MVSTTRIPRTLVVVAVFVGCAVIADVPAIAQWGGGWGHGFGMGGWASTAQQGAAEGISQVVRSQGYTNLKNSEAAINWEDAKTKEIDNRMKWTETYFEMRKTNREARAAEDDKLFADRAASGGSVQYEELRQINDSVSKFIDVLKQNVGNYAAGDYGRARTFLDSLARESRLPAG